VSLQAEKLLELMRSRRSLRQFSPEAPPRELLLSLIDAAITAPSASNKQPWRFYVIRNAAMIRSMADYVQQAVVRIVPRLDDTAARQFAEYGRYFVRFVDAPVVIAPAYRPLQMLSHLMASSGGAGEDDELNAAIANMETLSGVVSTSLAIQNLLLAAHASGLGASCMSGPLLAARALEPLIGIAAGWRLACLIPLGYPGEAPGAPERKTGDTVTRWID
jgi:nitroreductase